MFSTFHLNNSSLCKLRSKSSVMNLKLSAFWEWGSPDLPACGLRRGSSGGPLQPSFISSSSRPSRGAKPRGADDRKRPQEQPHQSGSRGGGEIKARAPREEPVTQAMTIETRRAPGGRRPVQCPCFPFGAKGASTGQGIRQRLPFRCNKTKTSRMAGWRSSWSQEGIIVRAFGSQRPTLVRIRVLDVPLQSGQLLAPSLLIIWEEAQGLAL